GLSRPGIELGGQRPVAGREDLEMDVRRAARVGRRSIGLYLIAALGARELAAPMSVVVLAPRIRLPPFHPGARQRRARAGGLHGAGHGEALAGGLAPRGIGLVERPF